MNKYPEFLPGDILCTIGYVKSHEPDDWFEQEENQDSERVRQIQEVASDFTGVPMIVVHQEFPFVICQPVTAPYSITSIDIRKYEFQIMTRTYLEKWKKVYKNSWSAWEREQNLAENL